MIKVTRLDDREIYVNADMIEFIEKTPDTIIRFVTGRNLMVKEDIEQVLERYYRYRSEHPVYAFDISAGGEEVSSGNNQKS
ncbi:MAG: flagellar protein FlbD [Candidatus Latescibacteria bacterium]|nr:flagellar protein FlbD [bacterium]MBD3424471.1 flagellar protein FlbD [Candidatus Latescibacterota bacterium]